LAIAGLWLLPIARLGLLAITGLWLLTVARLRLLAITGLWLLPIARLGLLAITGLWLLSVTRLVTTLLRRRLLFVLLAGRKGEGRKQTNNKGCFEAH